MLVGLIRILSIDHSNRFGTLKHVPKCGSLLWVNSQTSFPLNKRSNCTGSPAHLRPPKRLTCAQNNCVGLINQPFRLGTGDWGVRGGGLGTYTWRCSTMNKQPFRLGTGDWGVRGGDWGLIHGDILQ